MSQTPDNLPQEEASTDDELVAFIAPRREDALAAAAPDYQAFNGGGAPR